MRCCECRWCEGLRNWSFMVLLRVCFKLDPCYSYRPMPRTIASIHDTARPSTHPSSAPNRQLDHGELRASDEPKAIETEHGRDYSAHPQGLTSLQSPTLQSRAKA